MNKVFEEYKDIHKGHRVFLIANGPSLSETDLSLIENEYSFAMNRISMIYDKFPNWRPTYYLFSSTNVRPDKPWAKQWQESVVRASSVEKTTPFIAEMFKQYIDPKDTMTNIKWFNSMSETKPAQDGSISKNCFSRNVLERIDKSGTTMNLALQLVYHMGFSEVIFLGADLGWKLDKGTSTDPNHFDASYTADISKPVKTNNQMRNIHSLALRNFSDSGKETKFYNASKKTVLDVYPIIDFEEYIAGNISYRDDDMNIAKNYWDKPPQFQAENRT
jgi:hypothetical protein